MKEMKENWKDVEGYKGIYKVSDLGRVKSLVHGKERILKQGKGKVFMVCLFKKNVSRTFNVHILVAIAFLNHKQKGAGNTFVTHKDKDVFNNKLNNLKLLTKEERLVDEHHIRIGVSRKASNSYVIYSSNEMFRNDNLIVKIDEYSITFSVPSIDYNGKTKKTVFKGGVYHLIISSDLLSVGEYPIDLEDSTEDVLIFNY